MPTSISTILFWTAASLGGLYLVLVAAWHAFRLHVLKTQTGLPYIEALKEARPDGQKLKGNAVIAGGSIAGLLTARACLNHFERVIIVEPEAWVAGEEGRRVHAWTQKSPRTRVMQYTSLMACQALLYRGMSVMYPNFEKECEKSMINVLPADYKQMSRGRRYLVPKDIPNTIYVSRMGIETILRRLLFSGDYNTIEQIVGTVVGVATDPADPKRISKVSIRTESSQTIEVDATLFADCTGLTRAGLKCIERAGFGHKEENSPPSTLDVQNLRVAYDQKLHYTTQTYTFTPEVADKLPIPGGLRNAGPVYAYLDDEETKGRRLFAAVKQDGLRLVLFAGQSGEGHRPSSCAELRRFLADIEIDNRHTVESWVWDLLDILEDEESMVQALVRVPGTSFIQYQKAVNLPSNYVALGDSLMSVNPLFGQGCTKAMLGAVSLNAVLQSEKQDSLSPDFSTRFFKHHIPKVEGFWLSSQLLDYGLPSTDPVPGDDPSSGQFLRKYIARFQKLATQDIQAGQVMNDAGQALGTPIDMFHPGLLCKMLVDVILEPTL